MKRKPKNFKEFDKIKKMGCIKVTPLVAQTTLASMVSVALQNLFQGRMNIAIQNIIEGAVTSLVQKEEDLTFVDLSQIDYRDLTNKIKDEILKVIQDIDLQEDVLQPQK